MRTDFLPEEARRAVDWWRLSCPSIPGELVCPGAGARRGMFRLIVSRDVLIFVVDMLIVCRWSWTGAYRDVFEITGRDELWRVKPVDLAAALCWAFSEHYELILSAAWAEACRKKSDPPRDQEPIEGIIDFVRPPVPEGSDPFGRS